MGIPAGWLTRYHRGLTACAHWTSGTAMAGSRGARLTAASPPGGTSSRHAQEVGMRNPSRASRLLPAWPRVLVAVAHPDDEAFGLGAVIDRMAASGSALHILCFTRGEASTLNQTGADLRREREHELRQASKELGAATCRLFDYPEAASPQSRPRSSPRRYPGWPHTGTPAACWSSTTLASPATLTTGQLRTPRSGPLRPRGCPCWRGPCPKRSPSACARRPASHSPASRLSASTSVSGWTGPGSAAPPFCTPARSHPPQCSGGDCSCKPTASTFAGSSRRVQQRIQRAPGPSHRPRVPEMSAPSIGTSRNASGAAVVYIPMGVSRRCP